MQMCIFKDVKKTITEAKMIIKNMDEITEQENHKCQFNFYQIW